MFRFALVSLALATGAAATAQVHRSPPVDRCAADRSFVDFRRRLMTAVDHHNSRFILSIISDDIQSSFGGDPGRADFIAHWQLDRPAQSVLWRELGAALRLGCARVDGAYWAPSFSAPAASDGEDEPVARFIALAPGAVLRASASDRARIVAALDWDVMTAPGNDGASPWIAARLADGRRGFVRRRDVRDLADYRAVFERRGGRWRMTAFIAGD
jgi:hypothetical protein